MKEKCFVLVEGFQAVFSNTSKSILPLKELKYAILIDLVISNAAKDPVNSLLK